jgi:hypothetical protein
LKEIEMAVGDVLVVRNICSTPTQIGLNNRFYQSVLTLGVAIPLTTQAAAFEAHVATAYINLLSVSANWMKVQIQKFSPAPPSFPAESAALAAPGAVAGEPLPRQVAGLISFTTPFAGRRFRGRAYVPFPSENSNDVNQQPDAPYLAGLANLGTILIADVVVTSGVNQEVWRPCILHRDTFTTDFITGFIVRLHWATQRRRSTISGSDF